MCEDAEAGSTRQETKRKREVMQEAGVREEDAEDRERWRKMIHCGHS